MDKREIIARRVALELRDGDVINLGIGIPTLVANYVPEGVHIILQAECGMLGVGPAQRGPELDWSVHDAGAQLVTCLPGASFFDSAVSFGLIRGGHVDATVLGAFEVDEEGNLANYLIPGGKIAGMGGAMDLVAGAKRVIIAMEHTKKDGGAKILKRCNLPLTGARAVSLIVTDLAVIDVTPGGLALREVAAHSSIEEVVSKTEAALAVPGSVGVFAGEA